MTAAVFDNPATMAREFWVDGKLQWHLLGAVIDGRSIERAPARVRASPYATTPFCAGQFMEGSPEAVAAEFRPAHG